MLILLSHCCHVSRYVQMCRAGQLLSPTACLLGAAGLQASYVQIMRSAVQGGQAAQAVHAASREDTSNKCG